MQPFPFLTKGGALWLLLLLICMLWIMSPHHRQCGTMSSSPSMETHMIRLLIQPLNLHMNDPNTGQAACRRGAEGVEPTERVVNGMLCLPRALSSPPHLKSINGLRSQLRTRADGASASVFTSRTSKSVFPSLECHITLRRMPVKMPILFQDTSKFHHGMPSQITVNRGQSWHR